MRRLVSFGLVCLFHIGIFASVQAQVTDSNLDLGNAPVVKKSDVQSPQKNAIEIKLQALEKRLKIAEDSLKAKDAKLKVIENKLNQPAASELTNNALNQPVAENMVGPKDAPIPERIVEDPGKKIDNTMTVGGAMKMTLYDYVKGTRSTPTSSFTNSDYSGASVSELIIYFQKKLNDYLGIEFEPKFSASAGATPKQGSNIGVQKTAASSVAWSFAGLDKALVKMMLPMEYEMSVGLLLPRFSMEYGEEMAWGENFNFNKWAALGAGYMGKDTGIELYKAYTLAKIDLPTTVYLMNGLSSQTDNNRNIAWMVNLQPQYGDIKLNASYATGKWDDSAWYDYTYRTVGLLYKKYGWMLRTEYANNISASKKKLTTTNEYVTAQNKGYYLKVGYEAFPWMNVVLGYAYNDSNATNGILANDTITEDFTQNINFILCDEVKLMLEHSSSNWVRLDPWDHLKFDRSTIAIRSVF